MGKMDATHEIRAAIKAARAPRRMRVFGLRRIALVGSAIAWAVTFALIVTVVVWNARASVENETASAFRLANAAATMRLPTSFDRRDMMAEAARIAVDIRGQRHVTASLRDASGKEIALPDMRDPEAMAPRWFAALLRPAPQSDLIAITQYPNVLGVLEISTEPSDEIAEVWRDLRVLAPLLLATALVAIGVTLAVTGLVLRRLALLGAALSRMRGGDLGHLAPMTGLAELNDLTEGVNAMAAHLAAERAENRRLQGRMMALAEAERARIASDLHDEIGPQLFALQAAADQAGRAGLAPERAEALAAVSHHAQAIRISARAAIDNLRLAPTEGADLRDMVQELVIEFEDMAQDTQFHFRAAPDLPPLDDAAQIAVYRFVRESVFNALRHAAPHHVRIALACDAQGFIAQVCDDGAGVLADNRRGIGQSGMHDRAAALGGTWSPPRRIDARTMDARTVTEFRMPQ